MRASISDNSTVVVAEDQVSSTLSEEVIILNYSSGVYHGLRAVGKRVWELIEKPTTVSEVRDQLLEEYEIEPDRCTNEVLALLHELAEAGLIRIRNEAAA